MITKDIMQTKKLIVPLAAAAAAAILASCSHKTVINGTWEGGQGDTVVLCEKISEKDTNFIATAVVGQDGKFCISAGQDYPKRLMLCYGGKSKDIFAGKEPISVTIAKTEGVSRKGKPYSSLSCNVDGGRDQSILEGGSEFNLGYSIIQLGSMIAMSKISDMTDQHQIDSLVKGIEMMNQAFDSLIVAYMDSTRNSVAVTYFMDEFLLRNKPVDYVQSMYDSLDANVKSSVQGKALAEKIDKASKFCIGGKPDDFTLPSPDGTEFSLSQLRGHYTIIDFWASWCGPCLAEAPNVKAIYEKHHKDGLEILGVSLDKEGDHDKWVDAIRDNGLDWHQVSSLKGWDCPVAKAFNVTGIPRMFILDPDGKIIAQDLRGEELAAKIDELYSK